MTAEPDRFLENLLLFPRLLRGAGMAVSPEQSLDFARSLTLVDIGSREQVFHAARSMLVNGHEQLDLFAAMFNRFWRHVGGSPDQPQRMPRAPRHRPSHQNPLMIYMSQKASESDPEVEVGDKSGSYSAAEVAQNKAFGAMTPEELATTRRLIQEMRWDVIQRRTRRRTADRKGNELHLRQVMRSAAQYGGVPLKLAWQSKKIKQRPFVLLADISGSMEKFSRLTLQFFYSVSHSFKEVECFVFGTRLTRITNQLKLKNIDIAIEEASHQVWDWAGGTRIGDSLHHFNRKWSRRVLRRGAVVLIISDGWDRGNTERLKSEMRYLQHRCHRLIWLNPLLGEATYEAKVEGMTAALPYVDDFLPIHNLQSLSELSRHLASLN